MENDKEVNSGAQDFGNRFYDARIAKFLSIDRYASKFPFYSPYLFAGNTPIRAIDIKGDSVWIVSRYLNFMLYPDGPGVGSVASHSFLKLKNDKTNEITYLSFYKGEDGSLVKGVNYPDDANWKNVQLDLIETPKGQSDAEFREGIRDVFDQYESGSLKYSIWQWGEEEPNNAGLCAKQGNCHHGTTTVLVQAGADLDFIFSLDLKGGLSPGLGSQILITEEQGTENDKKQEAAKDKTITKPAYKSLKEAAAKDPDALDKLYRSKTRYN